MPAIRKVRWASAVTAFALPILFAASAWAHPYTVAPGDTFYLIAQRNGLPVTSVEAANRGINPYNLQPGMVIDVPAAQTKPTGAANGTSLGISQSDIALLARLVEAEEGDHPFAVRVGVAAVMLHRRAAPGFPKTVSGVVFQPGQNESVSNGWFWRVVPTQQDFQAVRSAVAGNDPSNGALYFFDTSGPVNGWMWSRPITARIGNAYFAR